MSQTIFQNNTMEEATMLKQITKCTSKVVHSKLGILGQYIIFLEQVIIRTKVN